MNIQLYLYDIFDKTTYKILKLLDDNTIEFSVISFSKDDSIDDVTKFGQDTALGRAGQPSEVAPAYVFLASEDSSYITGQFIHVNGGEIIGG